MNSTEKARITISLMDDGKIQVTGPLPDKILCYGLLECARQIVQDHGKDKGKIVIPQILPPFPGPN